MKGDAGHVKFSAHNAVSKIFSLDLAAVGISHQFAVISYSNLNQKMLSENKTLLTQHQNRADDCCLFSDVSWAGGQQRAEQEWGRVNTQRAHKEVTLQNR